MFVDKDETTKFFETKTKSAVSKKRDKIISTRCTGSNNRRLKACIFVARYEQNSL